MEVIYLLEANLEKVATGLHPDKMHLLQELYMRPRSIAACLLARHAWRQLSISSANLHQGQDTARGGHIEA